MKLTVEPAANGDVAEALAWQVRQFRFDVVGRLWRLWNAGLNAIEASPWTYPMVEDWPTVEPSIRNYLLPRYGYRIIYRVKGEEILVVAFARGRRNAGHRHDRITDD